MNARFAPVVAVDIDGVLRIPPLRPGATLPGGVFEAEVVYRRSNYPTLHHGAPVWDEDGTRRQRDWFSGIGAGFVRDLLGAGVEVVLATTWQHWANTYFSEILGFWSLPVAVRTLEPDELNWAHCSAAWKSAQLARQFDGRPLLWVDDQPTDRPEEDLVTRRRPIDRALTRVHTVNPFTGIDEVDVHEMNEWLALASTAAGHEQLREQRRAQLRANAALLRKWERQISARRARYGRQ